MRKTITRILMVGLIAFGLMLSPAMAQQGEWVRGQVLAIDEANLQIQLGDHWYQFASLDTMRQALNFESRHDVRVLDNVSIRYVENNNIRFVMGLNYLPPQKLY